MNWFDRWLESVFGDPLDAELMRLREKKARMEKIAEIDRLKRELGES